MYILKVENQFVCWHSYNACYYLGPKRLSELFFQTGLGISNPKKYPTNRMQKVYKMWPMAQAKWVNL